jgi:hypothetical protein
MKVGSLVECVNDSHIRTPNVGREIKKGNIYTIRDIDGPPFYGVRLEEIMSQILGGRELFYRVERFREVVPPIASVEEHINQNTKELQEI